jgi:Icc-related predicted phosphoesterase
MNFLIIGDLHGQMPKIHFKDFDAIIAPGDFCSSDEIRKYDFRAVKERLKNPKSKVKWYELAGKKKTRRMIKKSFEDGRNILVYFNSLNKPIYIVPGNTDFSSNQKEKWKIFYEYSYEKLIGGLKNIINIHQKIVSIGNYQIIGYGDNWRPEYPQHKKDLNMFNDFELQQHKKEYEKNLKKVSTLFEKASKPVIFLSHNVPFNTSLDKIINKESPRHGWHYGSLIARKMIDKYDPLAFIGGHIHEGFGKCKIGKTVCINAGFGSNVNTLMEIKNNKVRLQFYNGNR